MFFRVLNRVTPDTIPDGFAGGSDDALIVFFLGFAIGAIFTILLFLAIKALRNDKTTQDTTAEKGENTNNKVDDIEEHK